jgi:type IV secretion system protein VirB5
MVRKAATSWRPPEPAETPYYKARQEWDRRMGASVVQAANWRLVAFAELGLLLVASIGMIILGAQPKAVPHLVQVDKLGAATYVGAVDRASIQDFKPPPASFEFHLRRFVTDTREISSDVAVVKRNWVDAYHLVTKTGGNQLNAQVKGNDPFRQIEEGVRVSVQVNVVVPVTRETWQVDWTETTWDEHGNPVASAIWRGNFRTLLRAPDSEEELAVNPIGLYIDEFHWARLTDGRTSNP